jgi:hypothetical protein
MADDLTGLRALLCRAGKTAQTTGARPDNPNLPVSYNW